MKILFKLSLFTAIFFISVQVNYSCSCVQIDNKDEVKTTDFVFIGKVVEITEDKSFIPPKLADVSASIQKMVDTRKRYLIKFKVEKKFKGTEKGEITLVKYEQENSPCESLSFEQEKMYLIYAGKNKEEINDKGLCSRTQNFDEKSKDYKELVTMETRKQIITKKY
ncbi:MAG TPA: hypothetical protein VGD05_08570 [Pyrinomonadaceae bacterium]|jgi:hypothetical protein